VRLEIGIYLRVMYHFAEQKNPFARVFVHGPESDLDRIFHPIAKTEMTGQVNMKVAQFQEGWGEILFHFILLSAPVLDGGDQGTAIDDGDIESLHNYGRQRYNCTPDSYRIKFIAQTEYILTFRSKMGGGGTDQKWIGAAMDLGCKRTWAGTDQKWIGAANGPEL